HHRSPATRAAQRRGGWVRDAADHPAPRAAPVSAPTRRPIVRRAAPLFRISSRLAGWLFAHQLEKSHPAHVVAWWELRRLPYNLIVGATGVLSLAVFFAVAFGWERSGGLPLGLPSPPLLVLIAAAAYLSVA